MTSRDWPDAAFEERFVTASGPGGQNVNKVASAVQLRVNVYALGLSPETFRRLRVLAGNRMSGDGVLVLQAQRFRSQDANRQDARARFEALISKAEEREAKRIATRPGKAAKTRRIEAKKARSTIKSGRGKVAID